MLKNVLVLTIALMATSAQAEEVHPYFQLKSAQVTEVTDLYPETSMMKVSPFADCDATGVGVNNVEEAKDVNPLNAVEIFVDQIINIGKKIWAIIDAGRPVVNVNLSMANALPRGLACWTDLEGWQMPQSKVYRVSYENGFGAEVVTFDYRVSFVAGGSHNGVGQYITNAQMMPATLDVSWGFNFDAQAEVPAVFNMGSKSQPVAGMQMVMKWKVNTAFQHMEESESYHISGNNKLIKMQ
ncbi:MAG: hypothetical protein ACLGGX_02575 [Bdellovibrionia bacterium]